MQDSSEMERIASLFVMFLVACSSARVGAWRLTPTEAQSISSKACIYFAPMVMNYEQLYTSAVNTSAPFDRFFHQKSISTANTSGVVTPNDDTLYSHAWLDLRAEPMVLSVPEISPTPLKRYYAIQIVDSFTNNVGIVSSKTTGNHAGKYLIVGPSWTGYEQFKHVLEKGVNKTYQCGSNFTLLLGRTLVYNESDVPNVRTIQNGYTITPLSKFLNSTKPPHLPLPKFPVYSDQEVHGISFFAYANFIMTYTTIYPDEEDLFAQFAAIGIIPGAEYPPKNMSQGLIFAILLGMKDAKTQIKNATQSSNGTVSRDGWFLQVDPPPFGNHSVMGDHYLTRASSAVRGLYGLDPDEAMYIRVYNDSDMNHLNGATGSYRIAFTSVSIPKALGFWSMTLYGQDQYFYDNPINRYSIGDRTNNLYYINGSLTVYIQHSQPQDPHAAMNWLPAPNAKFYIVTRIYWPTEDEDSSHYLPPGLKKANGWYSDGIL